MTESEQPTSTVLRACDQCHARKVKCDGSRPCTRCHKGQVGCTFENPVLPKGPAPRTGRREQASRQARQAQRPRQQQQQPLYLLQQAAATQGRRPRTCRSRAATASGSGSGSKTPRGPWRATPYCRPETEWNGNVTGEGNLQLLHPDFLEDALAWFASDGSGGDCVVGSGSTDSGDGSSGDGDETSPDSIDWMFDQALVRGAQAPQNLSSGFSPISTPALPTLSLLGSDQLSGLGGVGGGLGGVGGGGGGGGSGLSCFGGFGGLGSLPVLSSLPGLGIAPSPLALDMPFTAPSEVSPILTLTLDTLIRPQLDVFYARIYPMIPVFPPSYIQSRLCDRRQLGDRNFVALVLAMVALSLVHPLHEDEMSTKESRARQSTTLLDEVCRLRSKWDYGCRSTLETVLTSYLMFGTLFELGHADGARFRLLEAIIMGQAMRLGDASVYTTLQPDEIKRRIRMYWILAVTERAYALQRSGTIVFHGPISTAHTDPEPGSSLRHLARVFSFIDQDIIACWNGQCDRTACTRLSRTRIVEILSNLKGSAADVFGGDQEADLVDLTESQKADLLITWQWIRNRIWRLAAAHGLTVEGAEPELSTAYVVDVATTAVAICRRLSEAAMAAHGTGFVEKLYDIANIVTELLQTSPELQARLVAIVQTERWTEMLQSLYTFVTRHRAGSTFAEPLAQAMSLVSSIRLLAPVPTL